MPKADIELINQFREKFGDLLITCDGRGIGCAGGDALPPKSPISHTEGLDFLNVVQPENSGLTLGLASTSPASCRFNTQWQLSPISGKHQISLDRTLPGSGAGFHNEAGDLHSPMVQWDITTASLHDTSMQNGPMNSWAGSGYFAPLSPTQHWLPEDTTYSTQPCYNLEFLTHRDSGYATLGSLDRMPLSNETSHESNSKFYSSESKAKFTRDSPLRNGEKFHYNVTLEAPTAMISHTKERPVTYLNKGQIYTLRVLDSKPPLTHSGLLKYRAFVRVSFEEQDQRLNPGASWQLWKEGRGIKEVEGRQSELVAVEYVDLLQDSAGCRNHLQIRLEKACVDGFCVTWTADPNTQGNEGFISLRFNFLSTDFSRSKGVKGVPVRLCVKTTTVTEDGTGVIEHDTEGCYCVVKLFRDHGAERKLANDRALIKKKIEKLNNQIAEELQSAGFV